MMLGRILGSAPGIPVLGKSHSALLCRVNEMNILFDCGEGTAQKLLEYDLDRDFIDVIIISHLHPDHCIGLFMVLQMFHLQKRSRPLKVYLPESLDSFRSMMNMLYLFPERFEFSVDLIDITDLKESLPEITTISNSHLLTYQDFIREHNLGNSMKSFSFMINTGKINLLYTSDLQDTKHLIDFLQDSDIIIIDALHPPLEEVISLINQKDKKIILIHGLSNELKNTLDTNNYSNVILAEDGYPIYA